MTTDDLAPAPFHTTTCPDCTAAFDEQMDLLHDSTCPYGIGEDQTSDADRQFFEDHPDVDHYYRPLTASERITMRLTWTVPLPERGEFAGRVLVTRVGPGVRYRSFAGVVFLLGGTR
ncbi:MAG: hypothetical protein ABJA93_03570 [Sporichthyaceae bacterium]